MKLQNIIRRIWHKFEGFAHELDYALDHSQHSDIGLRVSQVEHELRSQGARLMTVLEQVQVLTEDVHKSAGTRS